jgi:hypothetical protein
MPSLVALTHNTYHIISSRYHIMTRLCGRPFPRAPLWQLTVMMPLARVMASSVSAFCGTLTIIRRASSFRPSSRRAITRRLAEIAGAAALDVEPPTLWVHAFCQGITRDALRSSVILSSGSPVISWPEWGPGRTLSEEKPCSSTVNVMEQGVPRVDRTSGVMEPGLTFLLLGWGRLLKRGGEERSEKGAGVSFSVAPRLIFPSPERGNGVYRKHEPLAPREIAL